MPESQGIGVPRDQDAEIGVPGPHGIRVPGTGVPGPQAIRVLGIRVLGPPKFGVPRIRVFSVGVPRLQGIGVPES